MSTTVEFYSEGQAAEEMREGDFLLTHGDYLVSRLIRFGQRLR
jgi:hypothetical protein